MQPDQIFCDASLSILSLSSAVEEIGNEVQIFAGKEIKGERKENCQYQAFFTLLVCVEML